jgi:hypothetical protein
VGTPQPANYLLLRVKRQILANALEFLGSALKYEFNDKSE